MLTKPVWGDTPQVVANEKLDAMVEYSQSIHGAPIAEDAPANGDTLVYNSTSGEWEPAAGGGGGSTPTGTGFVHVTSNVQDGTAKLVENADVHASAAIAESKLALASDAAAGTASRRTLGTGATQAAAGNHSHSSATTSAAGMMSAADKLKLDGATDANTASALVKRDSSGNFKAATPVASSDVATKGYADGLIAAGAADADESTKGITKLSLAPVSDPIAVGDNDTRVAVMGASGGSHSAGIVGDPGASAGSTRYWREDAVWATPVAGAVEAVNFIIDGGGAAIPTGIAGDYIIPYAATIQSVALLADQSGSIVVDVWRDTYANFPPTDADSITASAPPTISTAVKSQDAVLTGWTTSVTAGDVLRVNVDSVTTIERVTLVLILARE